MQKTYQVWSLGRSKTKSYKQQQQVLVVFKDNASKQKCRLLWVSYGMLIAVFPFMDGYQIKILSVKYFLLENERKLRFVPQPDGKEVVCLQSANKFCYSIAVSRVQLSISTKTPIYFTFPSSESTFRISIITFSEATGVKLIHQQGLDLKLWYSVQVSRNQIFQTNSDLFECRMLTRDQDNAFSCTEISPLSAKGLYNASIC